MGIVELMIIAIGVSMDALAVSICKGLSIKKISPKYMYRTAMWFGSFQALMPLIGYFVGIHFADFVSNVDHWIAFILLALIGSNMIKESISNEEVEANPDFSFKTMFSMAVATSIDALAVGVSFAFLKVDIWSAILVIGATTAAFSAAGVFVGNAFGARYKSKAELAGGVILIAMGLKILLTHIIG
jgi:putative Mn2+ efflux pump MntP